MKFLIIDITKHLNDFILNFGFEKEYFNAITIREFVYIILKNNFLLYKTFNADIKTTDFEKEVRIYVKEYNYNKHTLLIEKDHIDIPDGYLLIRFSEKIPEGYISLIKALLNGETFNIAE